MSLSEISSKNTTLYKSVIYTRISSVAQVKKGSGLASQETRCREFARAKGYAVENVFSDSAVSGSLTKRNGIQDMLSFLHAQADADNYVVIIDDISRIARDIQAHYELRVAIADTGARLESPSVEFGEDSDSILVENLLASVSQHQRQKNAEQTKNRMRARMQNGYWPFIAPLGLKFEAKAGRGKVLTRDEPVASVIQQAIEGLACGHLQTQAEVKRFLESQPVFPKNRFGKVTDETANRILTRLLYAGMVESEDWGVSLREGQHEGLVSYETYLKAQERLKRKAYAPARATINNDFILRGTVLCGDCDHPLTACWSKSKTGKKHAYYSCFKKGCDSYRKSIKRDQLEGDFEALLEAITPSKALLSYAQTMLRDVWGQLSKQGDAMRLNLQKDIQSLNKKIENLLDRIVEADNSSVVSAYEKRISKMESQKALLSEKLTSVGKPRRSFEEVFELAMNFLANPLILWRSGHIATRQTVLKLAFANRPAYSRETGFSNPEMALPFKPLEGFCGKDSQVADRAGFEPAGRSHAHTLSKRAP